MSALSGFVRRAQAAADALSLEVDSPAPDVHRVCVLDDGRDLIARLTGEVGGRVRYFKPADDGDQTVVGLEWDVLDDDEMEHRMEQTLGDDLPVATTVNIEGRCFKRALGALTDRLHKRLPNPHRVVLCAEIVGRYNNATLEIYKYAGFDVERREFADGEPHPKTNVYHATMALDPPRTTTTAATVASTSNEKKKKRNRYSSEKDKTAEKKKKTKHAKLAN